jgi:hypothetical protein
VVLPFGIEKDKDDDGDDMKDTTGSLFFHNLRTENEAKKVAPVVTCVSSLSDRRRCGGGGSSSKNH